MSRLMYYDTNSGQFFPYDDVPTAHIQMNTNYETLKQMSEEELAEWLTMFMLVVLVIFIPKKIQ